MAYECKFRELGKAEFRDPEAFMRGVLSDGKNATVLMAYPPFTPDDSRLDLTSDFYDRMMEAYHAGKFPIGTVETDEHMLLADMQSIFESLKGEHNPSLPAFMNRHAELLAHFSQKDRVGKFARIFGSHYDNYTAKDFESLSRGLLIARAKVLAWGIWEFHPTHFCAEEPLLSLVKYHYVTMANTQEQLRTAKAWEVLGFLQKVEQKFGSYFEAHKSSKVESTLSMLKVKNLPRPGISDSLDA